MTRIRCQPYEKADLFRFCPPPRYSPRFIHSKPLCKNMARGSLGNADNMHQQSWGHKRKRFEKTNEQIGIGEEVASQHKILHCRLNK